MKRRLHIGGRYRHPDWEILSAVQTPDVDHVGNAKDLSQFEDNTFEAVYASHVLEHFDYENEIDAVLKEWYRVLEPGGILYLSVPDLDVLAKLFIDQDRLDVDERFYVMRMIFGGHVDEYDYHQSGFNREILDIFLKKAGYVNIHQVEDFNIFKDSSTRLYKDVPISVNLISQKPK